MLLSQVYCLRQIVKTPTIISNNPVYLLQKEFNLKLVDCPQDLDF